MPHVWPTQRQYWCYDNTVLPVCLHLSVVIKGTECLRYNLYYNAAIALGLNAEHFSFAPLLDLARLGNSVAGEPWIHWCRIQRQCDSVNTHLFKQFHTMACSLSHGYSPRFLARIRRL